MSGRFLKYSFLCCSYSPSSRPSHPEVAEAPLGWYPPGAPAAVPRGFSRLLARTGSRAAASHAKLNAANSKGPATLTELWPNRGFAYICFKKLEKGAWKVPQEPLSRATTIWEFMRSKPGRWGTSQALPGALWSSPSSFEPLPASSQHVSNHLDALAAWLDHLHRGIKSQNIAGAPQLRGQCISFTSDSFQYCYSLSFDPLHVYSTHIDVATGISGHEWHHLQQTGTLAASVWPTTTGGSDWEAAAGADNWSSTSRSSLLSINRPKLISNDFHTFG